MMDMINTHNFKVEQLEVLEDRINFIFDNGIVSITHYELYNYVDSCKYYYNGLHSVIVNLKNMEDFGCAQCQQCIAYINRIDCALWSFIKSYTTGGLWTMNRGNFVKNLTTYSTYIIGGVEIEICDYNKLIIDTDSNTFHLHHGNEINYEIDNYL